MVCATVHVFINVLNESIFAQYVVTSCVPHFIVDSKIQCVSESNKKLRYLKTMLIKLVHNTLIIIFIKLIIIILSFFSFLACNSPFLHTHAYIHI